MEEFSIKEEKEKETVESITNSEEGKKQVSQGQSDSGINNNAETGLHTQELKKHKKESEKKVKSTEEKLLESLKENEIKGLLEAKKELEEKEKILEEKEALIIEYEDLLKRKQAEFENYRKRIAREVEELKKYANIELVKDILELIDNFERAIESAKTSKDLDALMEGLEIIDKQFKNVLEKKHDVKVIESVGKEFDPNVHEAIMMEESDKYSKDTVVEDFQKGYIMYDRVVRPSRVKVAKAVTSVTKNKGSEVDTTDEEDNTSEKGE